MISSLTITTDGLEIVLTFTDRDGSTVAKRISTDAVDYAVETLQTAQFEITGIA